MRLKQSQIKRLVSCILDEFEKSSHVTLKAGRQRVFARAIELINEEFQKERDLEIEANRLLDDLERQGQSFERHKMFLMVKKKLAQEKGIVL